MTLIKKWWRPALSYGVPIVAAVALALIFITPSKGGSSGGGGGAGAAKFWKPPAGDEPVAKDQDDLAEYCKDLGDDPKYLPELPGPTPGSSGLSFTNSTVKAEVVGQTVAGIMADFAAVPEASVHWSEIDRGAILGSTSPHTPAETAAEAERLRKDSKARQKACENMTEELGNAFGDATVVETLTPELAAERGITQLAFWVYDPEYKTSGWLCAQAIPPDGVRVASWKRSFREGGNALGDTVVIAVDRRELVAFDCPGESFTGTQAGPPVQPEETPETTVAWTPEDSAVTPTDTAATPQDTSATPDTNADNGDGGGGTTGDTGDEGTGSGGQPGGGPNECTGTPGCDGNGPGGSGGPGPCTDCPGPGGSGEPGPCSDCPGPGGEPEPGPCDNGCPPEDTPPEEENPPGTQPPGTQPPGTTAPPGTTPPPTTRPPVTNPPTTPPPTNPPTTAPPVTQPPTTPPPTNPPTTSTKPPPPPCHPDPYPDDMPGACIGW